MSDLGNPHRSSSATVEIEGREALELGLDGVMRALVLPLDDDCVVPEADQTRPPAPYDEIFAAGQLAKLLERATRAGADAPGVVVQRVLELEGDEVRFGCSVGTARDNGGVDGRSWRARPAVCVTLWSTGSGNVLTIERLERRADELARLLSNAVVDRDLADVVAPMLLGTGYDESDDLWSLLARESPRRWWPRGGSEATASVSSVLSRSVRHVRGQAVAEGLLVLIAPDALVTAEHLVVGDDDEATEVAQASGGPHAWQPFPLARQPVTPGRQSLMRDDARVVLVDLESTSVNHDYFGVGMGATVAWLVPAVARRAALHRGLMAIRDALARPDDRELVDHLRTVANMRRLVLQRNIAQFTASPELFDEWSTSALLATQLGKKIDEVDRELAEVMPDVVEATGAELERRLQSRRDVVENGFRILGPVAAIATIVGMFAAFSSIPGPAQPTLLNSLPDAFVATFLGIAIGLCIGFSIWYRRSGR